LSLKDSGAKSLRTLIVDAAKLEMVGYVFGQGVRFCSALILSRLLFPEAFGQSVIVGLVSQGLIMISNVGVGNSIVQSPRGNDPVFLNTAFTVSAVRGCVLWVAASALAYPIAVYLRQPELVSLISAGSLGVLISGFSSTSTTTLRRQLHLRPLIIIEITAILLTFIANVVLAWIYRSVWGLIVGGLIGILYSTVLSHFIKVGYRNRFFWDRQSWREIYLYGRWIQGSSALCFVGGQADKFLVAYYLSMSTLGVYSYAVLLADTISTAVNRVVHGVLFPVLSSINRENPSKLLHLYHKARMRVDLVALPIIGALAAISQLVVDLIFDHRYTSAGWMFQALCVRSAMACIVAPSETFISSLGHNKYGFYRDFARTIWICIALPLGWHFFGIHGIVWAVALSEFSNLAIIWYALCKFSAFELRKELIGPIAFSMGFILAFFARWMSGAG